MANSISKTGDGKIAFEDFAGQVDDDAATSDDFSITTPAGLNFIIKTIGGRKCVAPEDNTFSISALNNYFSKEMTNAAAEIFLQYFYNTAVGHGREIAFDIDAMRMGWWWGVGNLQHFWGCRFHHTNPAEVNDNQWYFRQAFFLDGVTGDTEQNEGIIKHETNGRIITSGAHNIVSATRRIPTANATYKIGMHASDGTNFYITGLLLCKNKYMAFDGDIISGMTIQLLNASTDAVEHTVRFTATTGQIDLFGVEMPCSYKIQVIGTDGTTLLTTAAQTIYGGDTWTYNGDTAAGATATYPRIKENNNVIIVDKTLNPYFDILAAFEGTDGHTWVPDTSTVIDIYPANSDTQIVSGAAMSVKTGSVQKYRWHTAAHDDGYYVYKITATDDGSDYIKTGHIKLTSGDFIGANKADDSTIEITAEWYDTDGIAAAPDTSFLIRIYKGGSDDIVVASANMSEKDSVTGYYKYAWDISSVTDGLYNVIVVAVNSAETDYRTYTIPIKRGSDTPTLNGSVKFFDTNLIESATATEPAIALFAGDTDIIENIRDNQDGSKITLNPSWDDTTAVELDGDMDDNTTWAGDTNLVLADNSTTYLIGAASVEVDGYAEATADEDIVLDLTGSEADITDKEFGMVAVYFTDSPENVTGIKMTIADSSANEVSATVTTDKDGTAFAAAAWTYLLFDLSGDGDIDYSDIQTVTLTLTLDTDETLDNVLWDGLRFVSNILDFEYQFTAAQSVKLIELKNTDTKRYAFEKSTNGSTWTTIQESENLTADYALYYDHTGESDVYFRVRVGLVNQDGDIGVDIGDILILDYLKTGMWENADYQHKPFFEYNKEAQDNWLNKKFVSNTGKTFNCEIVCGEYVYSQNDYDIIEEICDRKQPFYMWLNGDRGSDIDYPGKAWNEENLYLVHNLSELKDGHVSYQDDNYNRTEENVLMLVEAAWIEEE